MTISTCPSRPTIACLYFGTLSVSSIRANEHIARIEQPVYKPRWVPPDYEKEFAEAFKW